MKIKILLSGVFFSSLFFANLASADVFVNVIPAMTSHSTPFNLVSADLGDTFLSDYDNAWKAFDYNYDGASSTGAWFPKALPVYIDYKFDEIKKIDKYRISGCSFASTMAPSAWVFQGSGNGTDWTTLDSQAGISFVDSETKEFAITSPAMFDYYRIVITEAALGSSSNTMIEEIEMSAAAPDPAPVIATTPVSPINADSATANLDLSAAAGGDPFLSIQWGTSPGVYTDSCNIGTRSAGLYSCDMTGLSPNTIYYVQAYADLNSVVALGGEVSFTTQIGTPIIATESVTSITSTSATANVTLFDTGGEDAAISAGWGLSTVDYVCDMGTVSAGSYSCQMTNLTPNTTYRVMSFASNSASAADGNSVVFTTLPLPDTTGPDAPTASVDSGTFALAQSVVLTSPIGGDVAPAIYYTLNGIDPNNTSLQVSGPIIVDGVSGTTVVLKAVAYDITGNKGTVMSKSYVFNKVITTTDPDVEKITADLSSGYLSINGIEATSTPEVTVNVNYTLQSNGMEILFPIGTVITRVDGGNFDLTGLTMQDITLSLNNEITNDVFGAIKVGISGVNLAFSMPVTVTIPIDAEYDGQVLNVYYKFDNDTSWNLEANCTVSGGLCVFQTLHSTSFAVGTTSPAMATTAVAVVEKEDGHGRNWKIYKRYRRIHNVAVQRGTYLQVRELKKTNVAEFERLKAVYARYKGFGSRELAKQSPEVQADHNLYKRYRTYRLYLLYKYRAGL